MAGKFIDIAGKRAPGSRLVPMRRVRRGRWDTWWECRCDCGRIKVARLNCIRRGLKSCGCARGPAAALVEEMTEMRRKGFTWEALGRMYGRSPGTVCRIVRKQRQGAGRYVR